jgi:hypothetical protein
VLSLVGGVLAAAGAFLAAWRWPTRGRRIQDHVALLKDLPTDAASQRERLLNLLDLEMVAYDERERVWLSRQFSMACLYGLRLVAPLCVLAWIAFGAVTLAPSLHAGGSRLSLLTAGILTGAAGLFLAIVGFGAWRELEQARKAQTARIRRE